jgi:hypothetical protein
MIFIPLDIPFKSEAEKSRRLDDKFSRLDRILVFPPLNVRYRTTDIATYIYKQ